MVEKRVLWLQSQGQLEWTMDLENQSSSYLELAGFFLPDRVLVLVN